MKNFRDFVGRLALVIMIIGIVVLSFADVGVMEFVIWGGFVFISYKIIDYLLGAFDKND
tara:strand:- start:1291 stop:1467 length:177 start_codon:yes stop_codon:yes gene_type:complete